MNLTAQQLASLAAAGDPTLLPREAVKRAMALFEEADRLVRADEIADENEEKAIIAEAKRLAEVGLDVGDDKISMSDAFKVAGEVADRLSVPRYKTERRFVAAMRNAKLTDLRRVFDGTAQELIKGAGTGTLVFRTQELTSIPAVAHLFLLKDEQKRKSDRDRKKAGKSASGKTSQTEISKKVFRKSESKKRKANVHKRKD